MYIIYLLYVDVYYHKRYSGEIKTPYEIELQFSTIRKKQLISNTYDILLVMNVCPQQCGPMPIVKMLTSTDALY